MAKKRSTSSPVPSPETKIGLCIDCCHGYVMSDGNPYNPLITECSISKTRYSQSSLCCIGMFERRQGDREVHPMIYLK